MSIFIRLIKWFSYIVLSLALVISLTLFILNEQKITLNAADVEKIFPYFNKDLTFKATNFDIKFVKNQIQITSPLLRIGRNEAKLLNLQNFVLDIDVLRFRAKFNMAIKNADILSLFYSKDNHQIIEMMTDVNSSNSLICNGNILGVFKVFGSNSFELNLTSQNGWHDFQGDKVALKQFNLALIYKKNNLTLNHLYFEYINGSRISLNGDFLLKNHQVSSAKFKADVRQIPTNCLAGFWPKQLFPKIQQWVTTRISDGMISDAKGNFNISEQNITKDSLNVVINCLGANLKYLDNFSPITQINGQVSIDGAGLSVAAKEAKMLDAKLQNIETSLSFDKFILNLKSDVQGNIAQFAQFIPNNTQKDLADYNIDFPSIKGNLTGKLSLNIAIMEDFNFSELGLNVKADMNNVILDQAGLIKFSKGNFEILNQKDKIKIEIIGDKSLILAFDLHHSLDSKHQDHITIETEISSKNPLTIKNKIIFNQGVARPKIDLLGNAWKIDLDLKDAEVTFPSLGYTKPKAQPASIQCAGEINDKIISSKTCKLSGKNFTGDIIFDYSMVEGSLSKLIFDNVNLGNNKFKINSTYSNNTYNYNFIASYLDLTNLTMDNFSNKDPMDNYNFVLNIKKMQMPNKNFLHDVAAKISQTKNRPIKIDFKAFIDEDQLTITKAKKNSVEGYVLHTRAASKFSQVFGIYKNIKKGELWIEGYPEKINNIIAYNGTIKLEKFAFTNTSIFTKLILGIMSPLNSPAAIADALKGGSLQADSFNADWHYENGILQISNAVIDGNSYDIKFKGVIDFNNSTINLKGIYIPSAYGINKLISNVPFIGQLLAGGKDSAFIGSNFSVKGPLKSPNVLFKPLSLLTLGFTRNFFN
jgi:hypothetical protein